MKVVIVKISLYQKFLFNMLPIKCLSRSAVVSSTGVSFLYNADVMTSVSSFWEPIKIEIVVPASILPKYCN